MAKEDFEIIVVDDNSSEDLKKVFEPYIGKINIRHIKIDDSQHPIFKELVPNWKGGDYNKQGVWPHTPALSINIGIKHAQGDIICITQPEIIHAPNNFINGYNMANSGYEQIFGECIKVSPRFNQWLDANSWYDRDFTEILHQADSLGLEYVFAPGEYYWFVEFIPRQACLDINGVDEEFLRGVYGEDDNFRARGRMATRGETYRGRTNGISGWEGNIIGIHQNHESEKDTIKNQDRQSKKWDDGAKINRERFYKPILEKVANQDEDWGSNKCVKEINDYFC
jgi:glycosyltransferase involved in cell wall biosynthesis